MKKISLFLFLFSLAGAAAAEGSYGIKAGLNVSSISNSSFGSKTGMYVGVLAEFPVLDYLGIQPEIVYSRQGDYDKQMGYKLWERINYINVPLLAKLYVTDNLSIDLGPQFGFLVASKFKTKKNGMTTREDMDDIKGFDFGLGMGFSYRIASVFDVTVRYNLGLTDLVKDNPWSAFCNRVFQVGVGYRF